MEFYEFRAMNTAILLAAEGEPYALKDGFHRTQAAIETYERRFTRFSSESELSQLNNCGGEWYPASADLYELVRLARRYWSETGGLFNPAVLEALKQAGYDRSMDEIRAQGSRQRANSAQAKQVPGLEAVLFDDTRQAIRLPPGMQIDLGGIAKGWIAEKAAFNLAQFTRACAVDAGGDMFLCGLPDGQISWQIAVENALYPEQNAAVLQVGPGAVATSSIVKRRWKQGAQVRHHLIDPRSGEPAKTEWLSVTVVASNAAEAEVYAKALLIAGPGLADEIADRQGEIAFAAMDHQGQLWGSEKIWEYLYVTNGSLSG